MEINHLEEFCTEKTNRLILRFIKAFFIFAIFKKKLCEMFYSKKCLPAKSCFIIANILF